jgi:hypothetical protein
MAARVCLLMCVSVMLVGFVYRALTVGQSHSISKIVFLLWVAQLQWSFANCLCTCASGSCVFER